jgi:hypothetical protein
MKQAIVAAVVVALCGCGSKDAGKNDRVNTADKPDKTSPEPAAGNTGIPDCDDYIAKMTACIPKLDAEAGEQMKAELEVLRKQWTDNAAKGGSHVLDNCKSLLEAAKTMYAKPGCAF